MDRNKKKTEGKQELFPVKAGNKTYMMERKVVKVSDIALLPTTPEFKHITCNFYGHTNPLECLVRCVNCNKMYDGCQEHDTKVCSVKCASGWYDKLQNDFDILTKDHSKEDALKVLRERYPRYYGNPGLEQPPDVQS